MAHPLPGYHGCARHVSGRQRLEWSLERQQRVADRVAGDQVRARDADLHLRRGVGDDGHAVAPGLVFRLTDTGSSRTRRTSFNLSRAFGTIGFQALADSTEHHQF